MLADDSFSLNDPSKGATEHFPNSFDSSSNTSEKSFDNIDSSDIPEFPTLSEITSYQKQRIDKVREGVLDELLLSPRYDTPFELLRWLIANDYTVDATIKNFRAALIFLRALKPSRPEFTRLEDVNKFVRALNPHTKYYPGGLIGFDKNGNVVYMQQTGRVRPFSLMKAGAVSQLCIMLMNEIDAIHLLVIHQENILGRKVGLKLIFDQEEFHTDCLYMPALKIYMNCFVTMQHFTPDLCRSIYIVRAPLILHGAFKMASAMLAKRTTKKISFLSSNWKEIVEEEVGAESIARGWHDLSDSEESIRRGGEVPQSLWYRPTDFDNESKMTKISVGARRSAKVRVKGEKGRMLRWSWKVSSGDVDFHIEFQTIMVWPRFRLSTEIVPEYGQLECEKSGEYCFVFGNLHGKIFQKEIKHRIELV